MKMKAEKRIGEQYSEDRTGALPRSSGPQAGLDNKDKRTWRSLPRTSSTYPEYELTPAGIGLCAGVGILEELLIFIAMRLDFGMIPMMVFLMIWISFGILNSALLVWISEHRDSCICRGCGAVFHLSGYAAEAVNRKVSAGVHAKITVLAEKRKALEEEGDRQDIWASEEKKVS